MLLLLLDRLVGGELDAGVLEHPEQDRLRGDLLGRRRSVGIVRPVEGDVRDVGLASAGHGDVEVLPGGRAGHDDVRGVDRHPLGAVGGDGVSEVDVLGDVVGR